MRLSALLYQTLLYFILASFLAGCTNDGGGGAMATPSSAQVGRFRDSDVTGLEYSTGLWTNGVTEDNGTFVFQPGEEVTFRLGGVEIGSAQAKKTLTPIDLVPGASDSSDPTVINICRLLISLDKDMNPENGISITAETRDIMSGYSFGFNDAIDKNPEVQSLFAELNDAGIAPEDANGNIQTRVIVTEEYARNHFESTIIQIEQEDLAAEDVELDAVVDVPWGNAILVQGQEVPVHASVSGGTEPYSQTWTLLDKNGASLGTEPSSLIPQLAPGLYTLIFSASDADGVYVSKQSIIYILDSAIYPIPTADQKLWFVIHKPSSLSVHAGQSIQLKTEITMGNPPFYYFWSYPDSVKYSYGTDPLDATFTFSSPGLQCIKFIAKDTIAPDLKGPDMTQETVCVNVQ